jgi:YHS domain-containing protein
VFTSFNGLAGKLFALLLATAVVASAGLASAQGTMRLVLKGYDPVAYFTDGKPVQGDANFAYEWDEGRYHFASAKHRDMFAADPERYAPNFGGYCTGAMSRNVRAEGDPEGWVIQEGKLYVFGQAKFRAIALADPAFVASLLENARKHWRDFKRGS